MWSPVIRLALAEREKLWEASPLPPEWSPESFALACRRTALLVMEGARLGWGKRELADWLSGPYERLAVPDEEDYAPASFAIVPNRIDELLETMRADLVIVLRELTTADGIAAFGQVAASTGLVARTEDVEGEEAIVPRSRRRMSLALRVMSLVAVDALTHPASYESELVVCRRCSAVTFDADARRSGACVIHASGVMLKR